MRALSSPKIIQEELKKGLIWPVYWIYGPERMKSREVLRRIRDAVMGNAPPLGGFSLAETFLDGSKVSGAEVLDSAQSMSLGGGVRFIVIRDAHLVSDIEEISPLLGGPTSKDSLASVCVFLAKDLDGRKKFSKVLMERAAVVNCEEVPERERESWIGYLAKARGLTVSPEITAQLTTLESWCLDLVDQELAKYSIALEAGALDADPQLARDVLLGDFGPQGGADEFLEAFLGQRNLKRSLEFAEALSMSPEDSLPLLGLLAWNVRHLALFLGRSRTLRLNSFLEEKLRRWSRVWSLEEVIQLQERLAALDFSLKQTPKLPLGVWSALVLETLRRTSANR